MVRMKKVITVIMVLVLALGMISDAFGAGSPTQGPTTGGNATVANPTNNEIETKQTTKTIKIIKSKSKKTTIVLGPYKDAVGKELKILFKSGSLKNAKKTITLRVKGKTVSFGRGAFAKCKKLKKIDLRACKNISFSKYAFKGLSKAKRAKIKIILPKSMPKAEYKKLVKKLVKMGIKKKNIKKG